MTTFKPGDRCRVVEYYEDLRTPLEVYPAAVERGGDSYVTARLTRRSRSALLTFHQGSGWGATPELTRWRLMPATDETAATAEGGDGDD